MPQLNKIAYTKKLEKALYPDNAFYKLAKKDKVGANATSVQVPFSVKIGAAKSGEPARLPLEILPKELQVLSYDVVPVYAGPIFIDNEDEIVMDASIEADVRDEMVEAIETQIANITANAWGATESKYIVKTTGDGRPTELVGATGTRKKAVVANLISVKKAIMKMGIKDLSKVHGLIDVDAWGDIMEIPELVNYEKTGNETMLKKGIVGSWLGIKFHVRHDDELGGIGLHYSNAYAKKNNGDVATTDLPAALFWSENHVRYTESKFKTSIDRDKPEYLGGTIMSTSGRHGASPSRVDRKGVVSLVFDTV